MSTPATFTGGLVQMRSGLTPSANLDTAVKLIGEAKAAGADYVQTPEMTNLMDIRRERMLAAVVPEENDTSLARLRELARALGIWLHIGSLAIKVSPDRAANRGVLIGPAGEDGGGHDKGHLFGVDYAGEIVARYDKIHMFDVDLTGGESYRESNSFRPGDCAVAADLPWGRLGLTVWSAFACPVSYAWARAARCGALPV